jgi:hypothetical protein
MSPRNLILSSLCAAALMAGRAEAKCDLVREATLHVMVDGNQILIPGMLGGRQVKFLFDDSFPASLVMAPTARQLGLNVMDFASFSDPRSTLSEGATSVQDFKLGDYKSRNALLAVFGNRDTFGGPDTVAVLGSDYWRQFDVEIDLKAGIISLFKTEGCTGDENLAYWTSNYNELTTFDRQYQTEFHVALNGKDVTAIIDSGSPFSSLTRSAAMRVGLPAEKELGADVWRADAQPTDLLSLTNLTLGLGTFVRPSPDILAGRILTPYENPSARQSMADFGSLQMDQELIKPARFRVVQTPRAKPEAGSRLGTEYFDYDAVLGVDFLLSHHVLIANSVHKLYFSYAGGPPLQAVSAKSAQ